MEAYYSIEPQSLSYNSSFDWISILVRYVTFDLINWTTVNLTDPELARG